jgi:hypothetical protein
MTTHDIPSPRRRDRAALVAGASVAVGLAVCVGLLLANDELPADVRAASAGRCPVPLAL